MRILGTIDRDGCKISLFKMGTKLAIKFEYGLCEQTYKLREHPEITGMEEILAIITDDFFSKVMSRFGEMRTDISATVNIFLDHDENEFEEII